MRFSVDPWDPGYGASLETGHDPSSAEVDAAVEVPPHRWAPVRPDPGVAGPSAVLFVDGVRRVDAQVWLDGPAGSEPALCASYAAGVVCCCRAHGAHLAVPLVRRAVFGTTAGIEDVPTTAGDYRAVRTEPRADIAPLQVLSLALQRDLAEVELLAAGVARSGGDAGPGTLVHPPTDDDLLVVDGPLFGRQHLPRAIGFVKSHRSDYLPPALGAVVARLGPGDRTPVFRLGSSWSRHTWYLRLPNASGSPWSGVVRVECSAELPAAEAVRTASLTQAVLPRYASTGYKDARAPQNLYPIAGLERALRRRLGDAGLLYRALLRAAATGGVPLPV